MSLTKKKKNTLKLDGPSRSTVFLEKKFKVGDETLRQRLKVTQVRPGIGGGGGSFSGRGGFKGGWREVV